MRYTFFRRISLSKFFVVPYTYTGIGSCDQSQFPTQISTMKHSQRCATAIKSLPEWLRRFSVLGGKRQTRIRVCCRAMHVVDEYHLSIFRYALLPARW